jgi:Ca2+-binding RTX toxin-like protein
MSAAGGPATAVVAGYDPSLHPDGRVFHTRAVEDEGHVFAKTVGGANLRITHGEVDEAVDVSPDGSLITYSRTNVDYSDAYAVYVRGSAAGPGNGEPVVEVAGNAYQSAFSPDGAELVYVSDVGGSWRLWRAGVDGASPTPVTPSGGHQQDPDWGAPPTTVVATCAGRAVTVDLALGDRPTAGDDVIVGTTGADAINAGAGDDVVCGRAGDDTIQGGAGTDIVVGGPGADTASYAGSASAVDVSLATTAAQATGPATGRDTLRMVERLKGSPGADRLAGDGADNRLAGGTGADTLLGRSGDDTLLGGGGPDDCQGGSGSDSATSCETRTGVP